MRSRPALRAFALPTVPVSLVRRIFYLSTFWFLLKSVDVWEPSQIVWHNFDT
jgi:hypothetical protein